LQEKQTTENPTSPVYALLEKPSMIDFPGHLCGVFFLSGCNFTCGFCHNATLMGAKQAGLTWTRLDEICARFKADWVDAICITGGEPTLSPDLIKLIKFLRERGFKIKLDSNGAQPEVLKECLPLIDYIAMDIKAGLSGYPEIAGFTRTEIIEESIKLIMSSTIDHEFRTTVIDPFHTDEQMLEAGKLIQGAQRYILQAFVPQDTLPSKEFREKKRTPSGRLRELEKLMAPYAKEIIVRGA
jgi:pyruvate formate lyase activating enzyme